MTGRDKTLLLSVFLLALVVIVTAVLRLFSFPADDYKSTVPLTIITAAIILISISSVIFVLRKIKKLHSGKLETMLNEPYYLNYEVIRDAISNSPLMPKQKREISNDVLDLLLSAQESGRDIKEVTGDPGLFAYSIIDAYIRPSRLFMLILFDGVIWFLSFVLGTKIILWIESGGKIFFSTGIDISMLLFFIFIAFILIPLTKKLTSTKNPWKFMIPLAGGLAYVILMELARNYLYHLEVIRLMLDSSVKIISDVTALAFFLAAIFLVFILKVIVRRRSFIQL